ncbi:hypothetical protein [Pseudotenacibaculum haliotis]|uniref:Prenyltransferase n=1 Tax=Pseudotenacibaculum haliotis TaxID=1862138 RepID=A0ABW5LNV9_9FLAO
MKYLKYILDFYINASVHVALSVYALTRITELYFDLPYNQDLDYFIFFGTITGYNFIKYAGVAKFYHMSLTKNMRLIQIFSFICFCFLCYYGWKLDLETLWLFAPFSLLTILYIVPFLGGFQKNLRGISYLKIFIVAGVWSGVTAVIPLMATGSEIDTNLIFLFVQRLLFIIVLILPFEIRDMQLDLKDVKTLPQKVGIPQTKRIGLGLLLVVLALEFEITDSVQLRNVFLGICLILLFLLMRTKENQSKYYSSFWVEALPIVWWVTLLLLAL